MHLGQCQWSLVAENTPKHETVKLVGHLLFVTIGVLLSAEVFVSGKGKSKGKSRGSGPSSASIIQYTYVYIYIH